MPGLEINSHGIPAVATVAAYLHELLDHAETVKPSGALEPALVKSDFDDVYGHVARIFAGFDDPSGKKLRQFAIVETAARDLFGALIATTSIESPAFARVWNLLDILAILSGNLDCDPALLFWLIEELLDSQTIAGCRTVFDYLESRRERITAQGFNSTKLVILRSCNDLLRRLSRADDTPFCGRVFIFLFQVFPLGDKSSVNLRGEYHVENVTTFDETPAAAAAATATATAAGGGGDKMDVDSSGSAAAPADGKKAAADKKPTVDYDALYPVFWGLQASFSQPKKLFDAAHFAQFKAGMDASLAALRQIRNQDDSRKLRLLDEARRGIKRKRDKGDALADTYNPKYLTSRDLFELETSDLTFRRHFLLQALIVMEFLLSLSPAAKEKLATASVHNKSVTYSDQTLSEEDTAWATKMKHDITEHIKTSNADGPYFLRMVDTILARDKNWVRWKVESCPSIERPPVSADEFVAAQDGAQRAFGSKHRRRSAAAAASSFSLDFLDDEDPAAALEALKVDSREPGSLLTFASFEREIADEDFEIEMPDSEASKKQAEDRKASKTWRALRLVRQTRLATFDKIDDDNNVQLIFRGGGDDSNDIDSEEDDAPPPEDGGDAAVGAGLPADKRPVVLVGPVGATAAALGQLLAARRPGVFGVVAQQTTRPAGADAGASSAGAAPSDQHVDAKAFDALVDGDEFVAFGEAAGFQYGTRRKQVEAVAAAGKVPLVLMNYENVEVAKGNEFDARYVMVEPADAAAGLAPLLQASGVAGDDGDAAVADARARAQAVLDKARDSAPGLFDQRVAVAGDDLAAAAAAVEHYIYGTTEGEEEEAKPDSQEEKPDSHEEKPDSQEAKPESQEAKPESQDTPGTAVQDDADAPQAAAEAEAEAAPAPEGEDAAMADADTMPAVAEAASEKPADAPVDMVDAPAEAPAEALADAPVAATAAAPVEAPADAKSQA